MDSQKKLTMVLRTLLLFLLPTHWLFNQWVDAAEAAALPNVVFIFADDMGYGEIEALNPERCRVPTPSLNRMAQTGKVFTDAHTSSSVCSPSRYALLTGRYNWRTRMQGGVLTGGEPCLITADRMTLGHLFQKQGYRTALFGKWHLDYQYEVPEELAKPTRKQGKGKSLVASQPIGTRIVDGPITRGFNTFYGFHHARSMGSVVRDDTIVTEMDVVKMLPAIANETCQYIDANASEAKSGKPFFAYVPLSSPHTPIVPTDEWKGKTELGDYGDFVAQTDGVVGQILDAIDRNGLTENTLVFFSADNGSSKAANFKKLNAKGHFPSANLRGSKADLWDGGHRVPFIACWPGRVKPNSQSHQLVCLSDMMATFAELFQVELADDTAEDSISFLPALMDQPITEPRSAIVHHSISGHFAIRQGDWKLLLAPGSGGWSSPSDTEAYRAGLPEMQLYNMADDLGEQNNLVKAKPEQVAELLALLDSYIQKGRSTAGNPQSNDAEIDIWKKSKWSVAAKAKSKKPK